MKAAVDTATTVATTHHAEEADSKIISLRTWMMEQFADDPKQPGKDDSKNNNNNSRVVGSNKESIIRKTTVTYGIVELLKRSQKLNDEEIRIDNFVVSISKKPSQRSWDDIKGVGMISSGLSLVIEEPSYLSALVLEGEDSHDDGRIIGRCLEVELTSKKPLEANLQRPAAGSWEAAQIYHWNNYMAGLNTLAAVAEESNRCHLFARLLYELFTHEPFPDDALASSDVASSPTTKEPPQKRAKNNARKLPTRKNLMLQRAEEDFGRAEVPFQIPCIVHMQEMGIPASICLMTQNLLEHALRGSGRQSDDAYESLRIVGADLHLLLLDPDRFLFDNNENLNTDNVKLLYRKGKLYGRDKEETLITDAFCRVTRGKSEAFFIGGFSGSGKSMLVNSLRDKVNAVGGYVTKHKFDAMSREEPLSGVISAFNKVCRMIKGTSRPAIAKKLRDEFGVDFSLLIRLLPSASALFSEFVSPVMRMESSEATMNARSVCFTLLRFVRVVSSPRHPIMVSTTVPLLLLVMLSYTKCVQWTDKNIPLSLQLFLDDMQWADSTALDVIHTILSDTRGSCMFFVGTYRDNEVQVDHDIFNLMERLDICNVRTTKLSLIGLGERDLNTMISDALCLYPRICKSLSDLVFQKTKGNPFFVLELMQSLKSRGFLQYNALQKRWVWNEYIIRAVDITDNVLHLLSTKMNGLSDEVQTVLKVMACFGSSTDESAIGYLSKSKEYAGIRNGLENALRDGFIVKNGEGSLQFAHDKVREAAYNSIPESDKKQVCVVLLYRCWLFCLL